MSPRSLPALAISLILTGFCLADQALPVSRTITDSKGRAMAVTITGAKGKIIKVTRVSDGKGLTIDSATLSADDQKFVETLQQGEVTPLPAHSSITLDAKTMKKDESWSCTPILIRGADMTDEPAVVRLSRIQQNVEPVELHVSYHKIPAGPKPEIETFVKEFPGPSASSTGYEWFAEVWQGGKIICKTYSKNKMVEEQPYLEKQLGPKS